MSNLEDQFIVVFVENEYNDHYNVHRIGNNTTMSYKKALETAESISKSQGYQTWVLGIFDQIEPQTVPIKRTTLIK